MPDDVMSDDLPSAIVDNIKDRVVDEINAGINNALDRALDPGGAVSGRVPTSGAAAVATSVARASCRRWARGAGPQGALADSVYRPQCQEYLDDLGELPGGGEYEPPFTGGQCPATYLVSLVNSSVVARFPATGQAFVTGPVSGIEQTPGTLPGTIFVTILANPSVSYRTGNEGEDWSISSVSRVDGQSDSCGNPPDGYTPTDYLSDDGGGTEPINAPGLPPFSIDIGPTGNIDVTFPGFDGPGREIESPFLPDDPSDPPGWYDDPPGWYDDPPGWFPEQPPPGDQGEPGDGQEPPPGEGAEGEDADRYLVGVKVVLTVIPPSARVSFLGERAFYSYAYSVLMGGSSGLERDSESAFAPSEHFYYAPENANRFSVAFRNGFGGRVIPYWRSKE